MNGALRLALSLTLLATAGVWQAIPVCAEDAPQALLSFADIDSRVGRLSKRIANSVRAGRMTEKTATQLQQRLKDIVKLEAQFRAADANLTPLESLKLTLELDKVSHEIETQMLDRKVAVEDISTRQAEFKDRIMENLRAGRLSAAEVAELKGELHGVLMLEQMMRADGNLTYAENLSLALDLDRLSHRLQNMLDQRLLVLPNLDTVQEELVSKVTSLEQSGVDKDRLVQLKQELGALVEEKAKLDAERVISPEKELDLALKFEETAEKIAAVSAQKKPAADLSARAKSIDALIGSSLNHGKLSPEEAYTLKTKLDVLQPSLTKVSDQPSVGDKLEMAMKLEALAAEVAATVHEPRPSWPGIDASQARIDHRIADATTAGRLTAELASQLKQEADKLAQIEEGHRNSGQEFSASEALEVARHLSVLNGKLQKALKDRDIAAPDVDKLTAEVDRRIAAGLDSGKLDLDLNIKEQLDRIDAIKNSYKNQQGQVMLNDYAKLALAAELEKLSALVERRSKGDYPRQLSFAQKLADLEKEVDGGYALARLDEVEYKELKADVAKLADRERVLRTSEPGLTTQESLELNDSITKLRAKADRMMLDSHVALSKLFDRLGELKVRLGQTVADGHLSVEEANELQRQLDGVAAIEARARSTDGGVSYGEALKLAYGLEHFGNILEQKTREETIALPDVESREFAIEHRLGNAVASGHMSAAQAKEFKDRLDQIAGLEMQYRSSGRGLSQAEVIALNMDLNRLATSLERELGRGGHGPDIDTRQANLMQQLKNAQTNGKISASEAANIEEDLDRLALSEAAFRVSDEGLSYAEAMTLVSDLDRIAGRLSPERLSKNPSIPDIQALKASVSAQLQRDLAAGKISAKAATKYRQELSRIARMEANFKAGKNRLSAEQAQVLATELNQLKASIK